MKDHPDLFAWADTQPDKTRSPIIINLPKGGNIIDALPYMIAKIRIEKVYRIPRPKCEATIIANPRWHERSVA